MPHFGHVLALKMYLTTNMNIPITLADVVAKRVTRIVSERQNASGVIPTAMTINRVIPKKPSSK